MELELRRARLSDLADIQHLVVDTVNSICAGDYSARQLSAWTSLLRDEGRWTNRILNQYILVATHADNIVGLASFDENAGVLDLMYTHKDFQRNGIADKLLHAIEGEARRRGTKILGSEVSKTARGFFEKRGFKVTKEQTRIVDSTVVTNYKMEKTL